MLCRIQIRLITRDLTAYTLQNTPAGEKSAVSSLPEPRRETEAQRNPLICLSSPGMFIMEPKAKYSPQVAQSCLLHICTFPFLSRQMQPFPFLQKACHCSRYFKLGLQNCEWFNTEALQRSFSLAPCFASTILPGKSSSPYTHRAKFPSLAFWQGKSCQIKCAVANDTFKKSTLQSVRIFVWCWWSMSR